MLRPGGQVVLPVTVPGAGGDVDYPEGLTEGNLLAMRFACQTMTNGAIRERFGVPIGQALIAQGYGQDQLPAVDRQTPEGKRELVEHALRLRLVRDRHERPLYG